MRDNKVLICVIYFLLPIISLLTVFILLDFLNEGFVVILYSIILTLILVIILYVSSINKSALKRLKNYSDFLYFFIFLILLCFVVSVLVFIS